MPEIRFCPLFSGSSGNSVYVGAGEDHILIDAGLPGSRMLQALGEAKVDTGTLAGIVVTHEHSDHISGVGVLSRKLNIPIYANAATWDVLDQKLGRIDARNRRVFNTGEDFFIGKLNLLPYSIPHDARDPVGYCVHAYGRKLAVMTDLGHVSNATLKSIQGAEVLLMEANHDVDMLKSGPYPAVLKQRILGRYGHLSNQMAGETLVKLIGHNLRHIYLGHLSDENNLPELAYATVHEILTQAGVELGDEIQMELAQRHTTATMVRMIV